MSKIRTSGLSFLLILALAFLLRVPFLSCLPFDSDQAIVGLMARHIVSGEFPLLYYGDSYGGALEPALASIFLHLFGTNRFILQLIPFLISLAFIISIYQLGSELFTRAVGLLSLLFATIPLYYSGLYSALANGGYIEILWLGNVLFMISHRLAVRDNPSARARTRYFILGLLSGLAWWTHPLSIAYLVTVYLFLCLFDKKFLIKIKFIYALLGFLGGSLPFWVWNLKHRLPFFKFLKATDSVPFGTRLKAAYLNLLQFFGLHLKGEWDGAVYFFVLLVFLSLISLFFSKPPEGHFPKTKTQ
jgi:4-amino-4-deoxy-L-arabinose transferase-like glycosyltransferase